MYPAWMENEGIPGISGVDTRALTRRLRESGVMKGQVIVNGAEAPDDQVETSQPVAAVSCEALRIYEASGESGPTIALLDCGVKSNILRVLLATGARVIRLPWDHPLDGIEYDGLLLSNGPGDRFLGSALATRSWPSRLVPTPTSCLMGIEAKTSLSRRRKADGAS
ncbi:MAG: carbamoyl-phosphate synthase small subunit [Spirochaetes bacterium]|nr:MAG: carbamoyl-phosphate synthase small subunit [Spirochaetota bacterium]